MYLRFLSCFSPLPLRGEKRKGDLQSRRIAKYKSKELSYVALALSFKKGTSHIRKCSNERLQTREISFAFPAESNTFEMIINMTKKMQKIRVHVSPNYRMENFRTKSNTFEMIINMTKKMQKIRVHVSPNYRMKNFRTKYKLIS